MEEMTRLFDLDMQLLWDVALMAVAVFFLFLFLSKQLFRPARKILMERQDRIADEISGAKRDKKEAAELKRTYETKLKEVDKEAEQILSEARQKAQKNAARVEGEAREEAARMLHGANQEAELVKRRILDEVRQEMIAVASMMAAKVVAANINAVIQEKLVEDTLREMGGSTWQS